MILFSFREGQVMYCLTILVVLNKISMFVAFVVFCGRTTAVDDKLDYTRRIPVGGTPLQRHPGLIKFV